MKENKKDRVITLDDIPVDGALGLLALGDVGVKLWRDAKRKKAMDAQNKKKSDEQKESK